MTVAYKVLGQVNPAAATLTSLYTVPSPKSAIGSSLTICNQGAETPIRVAVRPAGEAIDPKHYQIYDKPLGANDTLILSLGMTLASTDVVSVRAGHANVAFNLFGSEITG